VRFELEEGRQAGEQVIGAAQAQLLGLRGEEAISQVDATSDGLATANAWLVGKLAAALDRPLDLKGVPIDEPAQQERGHPVVA
jgi:hypothetical protein